MKLISSILRKAFSSWVCGCIAATFFLAACTTSDLDVPTPIESTTEEEETDSLGSFELNFTGTQATRATTTVITKEEADNFLIRIYKGSELIREATPLKDVNTHLSAGYGYKVLAENVSEETAITINDGWGCKRFAGLSASFGIKAGQTTKVNVGCSVANAAIEVIFDETVGQYFTTSYDVTIKDGDRTIVFDSETASKKVNGVVTTGRIAYFNLDEDGHHTVNYTIKAVGPKTVEKSGTMELSKSKISQFKLDYECSNFEFGLTLEEEDMFVTEVENISEHDVKVEDGTTEFNATHEPFTPDATNIETRAVLGNDGTIVTWEASDVIAVYDFSSNKRRFTATEASGNRAKFEGKVTAKSQYFAAIYPHDLAEQQASSAAALTATLPSTQNAVAGNIASALNISVGKGERHLDGSPDLVTFHNITQLLSFTVPAYAEDKISSITLMATTPIAGKLNINYSGDTPDISIASTESNTITILPPKRISKFEAGTYYIAAAPVQMSGFTLTFACDGKTYTLTSPTNIVGKAGCIYSIGVIDLINTPSASAEHQYSDGILQGTKVQIKGTPIDGCRWSATIKNSSGTVRTISTGTGDLSSPETDTSWPFLPKGDYTVSYTFERSNGTQQTKEITLKVPDPALTLTVDGYTAHTKYEAGDVTAANKCDRLTFYSPSAKLSVSSSLMNNSNYSHSYKRTFNSQTATTTEASNNPSWSNYTGVPVSGSLYNFSVTANFAGTTVTGNKQVRITGLPAEFTPPTKATGWANDKGTTDFNSDHVRLGNYSTSQPHRIKNSTWFNIPSGTKMSLDYDIVLHRAAVNTTANVKAGDQQIVEVTDSKYGTDVHNTGVKTFTTSANVTYVTCEGSYGSGATCSKVYKLFFQYSK